MERLREKLSSAQRALSTLKELTGMENVSVITRDAAIQRFEYTFEAVWKAGKLCLKVIEGLDIGSPKGSYSSLSEGLYF
ncbi:MAG: nucleotidyltransferase substrate binding protein [Thermodesulfobacteriota bacterium]|nr:nucleotidyltransferase substrate binding protein [Thermodesulfobacteriota bacterium]